MNLARASAGQLRGQVADAWARGSFARRAAILAGGTVTLVRAGAFGVALAAVSAALLWLEARLLRRGCRRWPPDGTGSAR